MALEWVVIGYAAGAEAIMVLLLTMPGLDRLRSVRYQAILQVPYVHAVGAAPPPKVGHKEPAQRALDQRRLALLLAPILRHPPYPPSGSAQPPDRQIEEF
ncbi:hypothetical protein F0562_025339 [Nyssa sinensis]|uniref:Uncharacterized protein n=1 Tax=Nyssa sinensis TaxID=561372 RepID=A0A5J5BJQ3_9ASTE|nr:hypothetical protein F0562_025339 [Nyssa sinensis]